jgi:hypothetical protein
LGHLRHYFDAGRLFVGSFLYAFFQKGRSGNSGLGFGFTSSVAIYPYMVGILLSAILNNLI